MLFSLTYALYFQKPSTLLHYARLRPLNKVYPYVCKPFAHVDIPKSLTSLKPFGILENPFAAAPTDFMPFLPSQ